MFKLLYPLPEKYLVAVSGGVDSMSVLHWLSRSAGNRLEGVIHFNHGTEHGKDAQKFVKEHCLKNNYKLITNDPDETFGHSHPPSGMSKEQWWRDQRYMFFKYVSQDTPIILAHNLDDCLEEYLMCVISRGFLGTIPYAHDNCIRPFRDWKKKDIISYAKRNNVEWIEDPSNKDTKYKRNFIRSNLVGTAMEVNPGLYRLVRKVILEQDKFNGVR